tara:strand:+ start:206 stop:814 length:609 start_codon:yes stop_codon:yes gene_type:complete
MDVKVKSVIDELDVKIANESKKMLSQKTFDPDDYALAAGPDSAGLIAQLIRVMKAKTIVEVGTSIGYTAIWLGDAARDVGGHVFGVEKVKKKYDQAIKNIRNAALEKYIDVAHDDAKVFLNKIEKKIDVAFVDAWKDDYMFYFDSLLPNLNIGGCIIADNMTYPESVRELMIKYQEYVRSKSNIKSQYLAIGSGLEMSVRVS